MDMHWNGSVFAAPMYRETSDIVRDATARLEKLYEERYQQGVRDGLNINHNALAQEVERLRKVLRQSARRLRNAAAERQVDWDWVKAAAERLELGLDVPE